MLKKLNLQNSYDKVKFLTILQFILTFVAFFAEALVTQSVLNFSFIFQFILLLVCYNFYYTALSNLFYSYWNISLIFGIYYLVSLTRNFLVIGHPMIGVLMCFSLMFLIISCYIISSPLFYPRFHWWEYDFRFRADIKCLVEIDGKQYKGRLSDLRRGAACLELFNHIIVGHQTQINVEILNQNFTLFAEVRSKREPIIGRSIIYGVRFVNNDLEQRQRLKFLTNYWNESKKIKIRNKFASTQLQK
ncbi:MAG TPA: PilZ domain-containing protein [Bacteriovoracaceae bacterium]|nr:PilZ domain-containing protein [Bacteriovoracaceae bacterium]